MQPRTVVFDLGEVLVPSTGVLPLLATDLGVSVEELEAAYWPHRRAYDLGEPATVYWSEVVTALGRAPVPALLRRLEELDSAKWSEIPPHSTALLDGLAAGGTPLAVLSNAPAPLAAAVRAAPWSTPIPYLVFSSDVGLVKPDPAIYAHADAVFGTEPPGVVFFDDRAENVDAARTHGWEAHVWAGPDAALAALTGGQPLEPS